MAVETTEQIVREAPEIEAIKVGLLESAKQLADKPADCRVFSVTDGGFWCG